MKILSIETSCDETAVSLVEASGGTESPTFKVLGNSLFSQIDIHKEYGGVYPNIAKREHAKNLPFILKQVLEQSETLNLKSEITKNPKETENIWKKIKEITKREYGLYEGMRKVLENIEKPNIDVISVTTGPGLAPALWVGISFAKALEELWGITVIPANHMEGHIASILIESDDKRKIEFPALAMLISGGHTEFVYIKNWGEYEIIGQTLDDAVGEAFDKVARMLGLEYPGGPKVSRLANDALVENAPKLAKFTRPMIKSDDLNFSFSGLKTQVLYYIRDLTQNNTLELSDDNKKDIAREFETTVIDVLMTKTKNALDRYAIKTLVVAGGVIASQKIAQSFSSLEAEYQGLTVKLPTKQLSTDNSLMIASATYINLCIHPELLNKNHNIIANGNSRLDENLK
ncbi:MAG: tRNA (adenosine(37)-N6)-threonylcarbamoyltransferase complex transferase subunit TsaD [Minisyncoccia bacterium]